MKHGTYFDKFIYALLILLIAFAVFLQISTVKSTEKLKNDQLRQSEQYASKIAKLIQMRTHNNIEEVLTNDPQLRTHLNETLHAFLTDEYQYIFLLYKDAKNKYRILLDASGEDAEGYKSIFFPKSDMFDKVFSAQKMQIIEQKEGVEQIWLSLVYPIVNKGNTEALLVLDLSKQYGEELNNFNSPLMTVVRMMQIFLFLSTFLLAFLTYRYYKTKKALITDTLTAVYSKQFLTDFFNETNPDRFYMILIDIDEFANINKKYGNSFGDEVLKMFARRMEKVLPGSAKIIRSSGAEFLVIVPKSEGALDALARTVYEKLKISHYALENEEITLSLSMSAMSVPEDAKSIQHVRRTLDEKLLEIKNKGKNDLRIIGLKHNDDLKYGDIDYIKEALEEERLTCLYQPIYDTKTKTIVKYEALVRLVDKYDPSKLISPFHFMDVIKGTSQYLKMSKLVFKNVFETLQKYPTIKLSVNVDLDDLDNPDMMHIITEYLTHYKDAANRLTFEILEEREIRDYDKVQDIFEQLKRYGSSIAIDDFGSGYASYSYLIRLDIDILKIDGSLIRELQHAPARAKAVLKSIQKLATEFKYDVVAEFVSHEDIYTMVNELDIAYSQGYYLGEPRPITEYLS